MLPKQSSKVPGAAFPSLLDAARAAVGGTLAAFAASAHARNIVAVDATCGNGNDTLFLARRLRELTADTGKEYGVLGLDVQQGALDSAASLLHAQGCRERVGLLLAGHEHLSSLLTAYSGEEERNGRAAPAVAAVMYNLGFLPRSDKRVVTRKESTLASLQAAGALLAPGGILAVHAYGGHEGGGEELAAVGLWCTSLPYGDWLAARYAIVNKPHNPEALFLAQKRECDAPAPVFQAKAPLRE